MRVHTPKKVWAIIFTGTSDEKTGTIQGLQKKLLKNVNILSRLVNNAPNTYSFFKILDIPFFKR